MKLRMLAAAAVLVSAAVHLYLWFHVFRHTHVVGRVWARTRVIAIQLAMATVDPAFAGMTPTWSRRAPTTSSRGRP